MRAQKQTLTDDLLITKAKDLATAAKLEDFGCSAGWLENFKKRHGVSCKELHGEGADAAAQGVELCQGALPVLITELGYEKDDVYNFDETALFFRAEPKRTLVMRSTSLASASIHLRIPRPHTFPHYTHRRGQRDAWRQALQGAHHAGAAVQLHGDRLQQAAGDRQGCQASRLQAP